MYHLKLAFTFHFCMQDHTKPKCQFYIAYDCGMLFSNTKFDIYPNSQSPGFKPGTVPQSPGFKPGTVPQSPGFKPGAVPHSPGFKPGVVPQSPGFKPGTVPKAQALNLAPYPKPRL